MKNRIKNMSEFKYKVGDKVRIKSLDWYNENKDKDGDVPCGEYNFVPHMLVFCEKILTIDVVFEDETYIMKEDADGFVFTNEMIEGLVEEETPKFKVSDIVFVKNIGWVRITNSYWDSLANEYIYEAIGFDGNGEYDCISQSNIEGQMLPESENPHTGGNKITLDEYKNNDKEWLFNKLAMLDNITALESIQDIFNHLQQSKYPKTYEECCKVMCINPHNELCVESPEDYTDDYENKLFDKVNALHKLLICRDAYWKIAGEEMGLDKPWEPDWREERYIIYRNQNDIIGGYREAGDVEHHIFEFPNKEMRDAFKENFDQDLEFCKEFL